MVDPQPQRKQNVVSHKPFFTFSKEGKFIFLCLFPAMLLVSVFIYYPLFKGVLMAFQNYTLFDLSNRAFIGLENFRAVISTAEFSTVAWNSVLWVFVSLFFQLTLGFILALLLRRAFKGRGIYQAFVFFPWAMSGFLIGLIWRWMFNGQNGVINDLLLRTGIIEQQIPFLSDPNWAMISVIIANIWYGTTFFAIMILAALQSIPGELYEAADMDGANKIQQLTSITIPFILPTLLATTLLRVIWILNFPDLIYSMTNGGPAGSTHIITTYMIEKIMYDQNYGEASAIGVIIILSLLLFAVFFLLVTNYKKAGDF
ncbi:carbohydrate ABC transporter permease [Pseudalkalibacillus caeni]|uniref:Sugar ABC transporter permease n=1 Tax=Exobacillus caeni TaxID=2574798 RepID=A0A5R9F541_9BACL|nr:sugar ABC transporter permease [Pseudalkalibacillus caeni]TLS38637.1 sugar ABC transporter permease [Pseudalkalibacillus caeni]